MCVCVCVCVSVCVCVCAAVIDFGAGKSTRLSTSSFKAETLIAQRVNELAQKLGAWLQEIFCGCEELSDLHLNTSEVRRRIWTDAYDVFAAVKCPRPYSGAEPTMHVYVESLKEDLRAGRLDEVGWCPTECQLADSLTKWMVDKLIGILMDTGRWTPTGYELLRREELARPLGEAARRSGAAARIAPTASTRRQWSWRRRIINLHAPGCSSREPRRRAAAAAAAATAAISPPEEIKRNQFRGWRMWPWRRSISRRWGSSPNSYEESEEMLRGNPLPSSSSCFDDMEAEADRRCTGGAFEYAAGMRSGGNDVRNSGGAPISGSAGVLSFLPMRSPCLPRLRARALLAGARRGDVRRRSTTQ